MYLGLMVAFKELLLSQFPDFQDFFKKVCREFPILYQALLFVAACKRGALLAERNRKN